MRTVDLPVLPVTVINNTKKRKVYKLERGTQFGDCIQVIEEPVWLVGPGETKELRECNVITAPRSRMTVDLSKRDIGVLHEALQHFLLGRPSNDERRVLLKHIEFLNSAWPAKC